MGTFNLTCTVTKTPIIDGDKCVIFLFKPTAAKQFMDRCGGLTWAFEKDFVCVYKGKYNGYGRVDSCPVENLYDTNQYLPFAISKEAWEFGIELSKSQEYKDTVDHIQNLIDINVQFKKLDSMSITGDALVSSLKAAAETFCNENIFAFGAEYKILSCLDRFCRANHFNMFEQDIYCSQSINYDDMKQWEKLRNVRIKHLKTKVEE
jgi:hypothetical protein